MDVRITIRQLGKKRSAVEARAIALPCRPETLRELICTLARCGAEGYNARLLAGEGNVRPMTQTQLADMETVGHMAFGVVYSSRQADPEKAAADAMQAFEDGLFRVFQGQEELTAPDTPLNPDRGSDFTFIRLTMLTGSIW